MKVETCRICKTGSLEIVLDYGNVALSDDFLNSETEIESEKKYPLRLCICNQCKHTQIDEIVDPNLLFKNYSYETGVSSAIIEFAGELYEDIIEVFGLVDSVRKPRILEIASNDGTVLSVFKKNGSEVLGIDPAENIVQIANSRGIDTIAKYFNSANASDIAEQYGTWDICMARNVMAHVNELHSFSKGIKTILNGSGFAVIEVPHVKTMFEQLQYDQVFHEHIGYHSLDSFVRLFDFYEMEVFRVQQLWVHGGSIRVYLQHKNGPRAVHDSVAAVLNSEVEIGLFERSSWEEFAQRILEHRKALREELSRLKTDGQKIAVYGASGKGQSLLQFCDLDRATLDYVVDKSKKKQGKLTPGTHIEIYPPSHIYEDLPNVILLCAWNLANEIVKQEKRFLDLGGVFIHPLPMPHYL